MKCTVVEDLIPLVLDGVASKESEKLVKDHIRGCSSCQAYYEDLGGDLTFDLDNEPGLEKIQGAVKKDKRKTVFGALALGLVLLALLWAWASKKTYLGLENVKVEDLGTYLVLNLSSRVEGYDLDRVQEDGKTTYTVSLWSRPLDRFLSPIQGKKVLLEDKKEDIYQVYLFQGQGKEDALIYGPKKGGQMTLGRLAWRAYLFIIFLLLAFSASLFLRSKSESRKKESLGKNLSLVGLSYLLGHCLFYLGRGPIYDLGPYLLNMAIFTGLIYLALKLLLGLKRELS